MFLSKQTGWYCHVNKNHRYQRQQRLGEKCVIIAKQGCPFDQGKRLILNFEKKRECQAPADVRLHHTIPTASSSTTTNNLSLYIDDHLSFTYLSCSTHQPKPVSRHSRRMDIAITAATPENHMNDRDQTTAKSSMNGNILFRQPERSHLGDCPICILPLSLDTKTSIIQSCCTKMICTGCYYASIKYEVAEKIGKGKRTCPICRQPEPKTKADVERYKMKRIRVNDPVAIREAGKRCYHQGDFKGAFEYCGEAAEFGDAEAHYCLSFLYDGNGVESDMAIHHLEEAAIGGHPEARHNLGVYEMNRGRIKRGVKHFIIAANNGNENSVKALKELREARIICQEEFESTLRTHQEVLDASNSPQREAAVAAMQTLTLSRRAVHEHKPRENRESDTFHHRHINGTSAKKV